MLIKYLKSQEDWGKGIRQVKDATNDIKKEINDSAKNHGIDTDISKSIQKEIEDVKRRY